MENEINQKQNHKRGSSSSNGGKKATKKKPQNSALRCCTNSTVAMKTCKARGRKNIETFRSKLKTLVENMEAKAAEMRREREEMLEISAAAGEIKLKLDLLKVSINQNTVEMIRITEDVNKLAEILLLQLN
ncbi:hypothetical protein SLE2022_038600 [Rubroshorea leprosula]